jgi:hypothetical protein
MSTIPQISGSILGLTIFLFIYWRRLKEDYISDVLFTTGSLIAIGALSGALFFDFLAARIQGIPNFNPHGMWFWGAVIGVSIFFIIVVSRFKMRFFELLETMGVSFLPWFSILLVIEAIKTTQIYVYFFVLLPVFTYLLFVFLETRYKKFTWYKSGRVGFSGLTALAIFFLLRAPIAIVLPDMVSFIGKVDAIASAVVAFLLFFTVYNLSEN